MKKMAPGLTVGSLFALAILLSRVAFLYPNKDSGWLILALYGLLSASFFAAGFWYKRTGGAGGGIRIGSLTAILSFAIITAASFFGLRQTVSLKIVVVIGLVLTFWGGIIGGFGAIFAVFLNRKHGNHIPPIIRFSRLILSPAIMITAGTAILMAAGILQFSYLLVAGWIIILITVSFVLIIAELLRQSEQHHGGRP